MEFTFSHTDEVLPRNANRSDRLRKKLKVQEYQEILFDIALEHKSEIDIDDDKFDAVLDFLFNDYRANEPFVGLSASNTNLLVCARFSGTNEEREQFAKELVTHLLCEMSKYWVIYAEVTKVNIRIGDVTYGNW